MKVICISAKARHGKDTAAGYLKECFEKDNKSVIFSQYSKYIKFYLISWGRMEYM